jgi:outer membrane lipoprotein-sorting protein
MTRSGLNNVFAVLAATLVALAAAACGAGDGAAEALADAGAATREVDTMRVRATGTVAAGADSIAFEGTGAADNRSQRSSMRMTTPNPAGGGVINVAVVMDGTTMYMRMPGLLPGNPWLSMDLQKAGEESGVDVESLLQLGQQNDPTRALDYLRAVGTVEELGTESVRGVETTRYVTELDFTHYADVVEADNRAAAKALRALVEDSGGSLVMPIEVWVDEEGLVRRQSFEQEIPDGGTMKMSMELYDFGAAVDIEVPAAKDVVSIDELGGTG